MDIKILQKTFYHPTGYQKNAGQLAEAVLRKGKHIDLKVIQAWLDKQAMYQIYRPKPKFIRVPRFSVSKPNDIHQADLLFLPHDKVGAKLYKYVLSIIDIASRYKAAIPLTTKSADEVGEAFKSVYNSKTNPLKWPRLLQVDEGKEFKGIVTQIMTNHKVIFERGEPGNHKAQAVVERFNRTLGELIFPHQYAQEMINSKERSREWVKQLPSIITKLNNQTTALIDTTPKAAIKLDSVTMKLLKYDIMAPNEEVMEIDSLVRFLYAPGELEGGDRRRATDPIWSVYPFEIDRIMEIENQPVLYFLKKFGDHTPPRRSFVREELQIIPTDFEAPPSFVKK